MTTLERRAYGLDRPWPERQRPQILDLDVWTALLRLDLLHSHGANLVQLKRPTTSQLQQLVAMTPTHESTP